MPKLVNDFRYLLDDKSIDAFMVATPDHWHALLTIHGSKPRLLGATEGAAIYGENGWMLLNNSSWTAYDAVGNVVKQGQSSLAEAQQVHIRNVLDAVRSRNRESLNQEIYSGHVSTLMCHAGNIAWRTGKKLRLDTQTESFDEPAANQLIGREHRRGYELPTIG